MRLHRLELTAFGPFAGHESIDFEPLNASGLFLLNGVTGAGKTSVLDALCFALYGSVPGGRGRNGLRSHHAAPTAAPEVELEFTAAGRRFRLTRSPYWETPSARAASGTAVRQPKALLTERGADGEWVSLATRIDDVGEQVREVVGLSVEQFTQVILLPQGEFAQFLRASSGERETVLKRLFGTAFYERLQEELAARSRAARGAADAAATGVDRLVRDAQRELEQLRSLDPAAPDVPAGADDPDVSAGPDAPAARGGAPGAAGPAVAALRDRVLAVQDRARAVHEELDARLADAERHAAGLQEELRLRQRLEELRAEEDELGRLRPGIEQDRATLERHRAAVPLRVVLDARRRARDGVVAAEGVRAAVVTELGADDELRAAGTALPAEHGPSLREALAGHRAPPAGLRAAADQVLAAVRQARGRETELARLTDTAAALRAAVGEAERARAGHQERLARLEAERGALVRRRDELAPRAERADELSRAARDTAAVLASSRELREAGAREVRLREGYREAEQARRTAAREAELLQQRRFEHAAGILAAGLEPGLPCPVCGSAEHPAPAGAGGAADVTDEALRAALARRDAAAEHAEAARREHEDAHDVVVRLRAGGATEDLTGAERAARDAAAAAEQAATAGRELAAARAGEERILSARERTEQDRHESEVALSGARARLEQTVAQHDVLAAELAAAAGGFPDLAGMEAAVDRLVAALARLAGAHDQHERARRADEDTGAQLRAALADSSFEGEDELSEALLGPAEAAERQQRVDDADARALRASAGLGAPELAAVLEQEERGAPAPTPGDLAAAQGGLVALRAQRDGSTGRLARLAALLDRLGVLAGEAATADADAGAAAAEAAVLRDLADTANATSSDNALRMTLNSFVLAAQLEEVAVAASERLEGMTGGRYRLVHTDAKDGGRKSGLGLEVEDAWTSARRGTESLSGGETFMASLALALGLADVVQARAGGVEIDTLFVDEGFGSLDEETLEEVMDTIDGLRERGRVIGLVSHVQEMKSRIPHQIRVHRSPRGSTLSVIG